MGTAAFSVTFAQTVNSAVQITGVDLSSEMPATNNRQANLAINSIKVM